MPAHPYKALMGPHMSIYEYLKSVVGMTKPASNIRFSPAVLDQMKALVDSGQYLTVTDIVNQAVIEFLERKKIEEILRAIVREEIRKEKEKG